MQPSEITTEALESLMPIVAHRGFSKTRLGLRDKDGFCPLCALVDEVIGWGGDKTNAWSAMSWLLGHQAGCLEIDQYTAITNIVTAADADDITMPRAQRLRFLLGVKS